MHENLETLFKTLLVEQRGTLLKVARAYTFAADDCQDLTQEILLQVWRSLPQFEARSSPSTWFYRVALNTALGWKRTERRRASRVPIFEVEQVTDTGPDSAAQSEQRETIERLYAAIRQLPKTDAALVLLYLDNLSYRQMAEVLGISESHVGVKLNRAKHALGELMKEASHGS